MVAQRNGRGGRPARFKPLTKAEKAEWDRKDREERVRNMIARIGVLETALRIAASALRDRDCPSLSSELLHVAGEDANPLTAGMAVG